MIELVKTSFIYMYMYVSILPCVYTYMCILNLKLSCCLIRAFSEIIEDENRNSSLARFYPRFVLKELLLSQTMTKIYIF